MGIIFDLDQTIIDSRIAYETRKNRDWKKAYSLIPEMTPYADVVNLIKILPSQGVEVAIVTSSPRPYCEKILKYLGITQAITVCYHDTKNHKPDPDPYQLAISKMKNKDLKSIIAIGDEEIDIKAAQRANIFNILTYWGNPYSYYHSTTQPNIFCRDEESLIRLFCTLGNINIEKSGLRRRTANTYQLFDYYPKTKTHDQWSEFILDEVKGKNNNTKICDMFCWELKKTWNKIPSNTYGIFVVPSSKMGKWNEKLVNYVVPKLVKEMGLIDCSKYILRHTTRDKQAYGGDRNLQSNLQTIKLQYTLPPQMKGAFIIDDITTSGNSFESCKQLLYNTSIDNNEIYCVAIGGTV